MADDADKSALEKKTQLRYTWNHVEDERGNILQRGSVLTCEHKETGRKVVWDTSKYPESVRVQLFELGVSTKMNNADTNAKTPLLKMDAQEELDGRMRAGHFNKERETLPDFLKGPAGAEAVAAVAKALSSTEAHARDLLKVLTPDQFKATMAKDSVQKALAKVRAQTTKGLDAL